VAVAVAVVAVVVAVVGADGGRVAGTRVAGPAKVRRVRVKRFVGLGLATLALAGSPVAAQEAAQGSPFWHLEADAPAHTRYAVVIGNGDYAVAVRTGRNARRRLSLEPPG
jgi:hypothetical protein